jgi:Isochorismatase family
MQSHRKLPIPDTLADACEPDRLALIVYDMHAGVVGQLPDAAQLTERAGQVLESARRAGVRVFFTRHMTLPRELMGISQLRTAMAWQRRQRVEEVVSPFLRDSPGFQIVPELASLGSEAVFDKLSMSAFEGTRSGSRCATPKSPPSRSSASRPRSASSRPFDTAPTSASFRWSSPTRAEPGTMQRPSAPSKALAFAGDAILTDISTITGLLARPPTGEPRARGPDPAAEDRPSRPR